jgi:hypothetical protein
VLSCRLTNRWEASLWLKGRQLYLGGFNSEEDAARAYDIVALSCKGLHVATNFPSATYTAELAELAGSTQVWSQTLWSSHVRHATGSPHSISVEWHDFGKKMVSWDQDRCRYRAKAQRTQNTPE